MNIKTVKDLAAAIKESGKTTQAYDTQATVTRVTGGTAWVHIPGGVDETPVQLSVNAKKGDTVNVRVSGGRAWITGNSTAPPTDDTAAKVANKNALKALKQIKKLDGQVEDLEEINYITEDTPHYLATDQGEGVTIETQGWTEEPQFIDETNRYLWIYHTYTLANGNTVDTDPVIAGVYGEEGPQGATGATGATGETGATGKGISSVQPQYRLSTSSTSLVGGSWSTSLVYTSGYYIWTREEVTYDDGSVNYSTAIYDQALTTACSLAYDTAQYFWVNDTGTTAVPTGAYVTETPQDSYKTNPTLGSILLRSAGIYIRYAAQTIAQFLSSGMTLLSSAGNKLAEFLSTGIALYDGNGNTESNKVAEFTSSTIKLGKETAEINLCKGAATLKKVLGYGGDNSFNIISNPDYNQSTQSYGTSAIGLIAKHPQEQTNPASITIGAGGSPTVDGSVSISAKTFISMLLQQGGGSVMLSDRNLVINIGDISNPSSILKGNIYLQNVNTFSVNGSNVVTEGKASSANPAANGTAAPGTSTNYARADHVHPIDEIGYNQLASGSHQATAADTWEYTGISFTTTKSCVLYIRTNTSSARKRPTGLGLHSAATLSSGSYPDEIAYEAGYAERTPLYWVPSGTYYVYQKRAAAGTAAATITVNEVIIE